MILTVEAMLNTVDTRLKPHNLTGFGVEVAG